jgi:antitoxin (DNA-binding transcriptional repressor) of toxin-antitoxin stability system
MRTVSITVTEASRKFADCINRARYQGTTFVLHKGGVAVARIVPEPKGKKEEGPELVESASPEQPDPPRGESANWRLTPGGSEIW